MKFKYFVWCLVAALGLVSCSEEDDTTEEFPDWQEKNDNWFSQKVSDAQAKKTAGDKSVDLFVSYTKPDKNFSYQYFHYVVVEKLTPDYDNSAETEMPLTTDSVAVSYLGRLIPSADKYKEYGMEFDRTYGDKYDPAVSSPATMAVSGVVDGFATALMHMHRGDHWKVYIPYQLGYGTAAKGSIPAYSTLIFDLHLEDFWQKNEGDRD